MYEYQKKVKAIILIAQTLNQKEIKRVIKKLSRLVDQN